MLRSLLAAIATAKAAAKARETAYKAIYGMIAGVITLIALIFGAMGVFFALTDPLGPAWAAASVAGGLVLLAGLFLLIAWPRDRGSTQEELISQLGLPALGIKDSKDVEAMMNKANAALRRVGPVKLSLAALVVGFLISRLR